MSFTDIFIKRPVLASVVSLLILLIGAQAGFKLPIRQYPELSNTTITVTTVYPGANADLIQGFITVPIQQAVASTEGIDTLVATSTQNVSTVTLNLKLDADPDRAMTDVLSKVAQVKGILPREADDSIVTKKTGEGYALMYLSFNSKVMNSSQISDYLNRVVQPKLQTIDGVANAEILGGQIFAMRIWLDPDRMAALGVTPLDVRAALASNNFTSAPGQVKGDFVQTNIDAKTSLDNPAAFGRLVVLNRGDALIRLSDVAEIELGPQSADSSSVFDGLKAVFIGVYATPTANPLTVITNVRKAVPEIQRELPVGLEATIAYDATNFIRASLWEVVKTLSEAALIVVVVIFLFLGNLRSTIIPIVTIPLSLIGVLGLLAALGYSINLMTLLALVLAIGLVVDDAIVVVENIYRHIEEGHRADAGGADGRSRDRLSDHRHDHHACRGVRADRLRVGPYRRSVQGIRLHPCRRRARLRRDRAHALADDVLAPAQSAQRRWRRTLHPLPRPHVRWAEATLSTAAARHSQLPPGDLARARWRDRRDRPHVHDDAEGARAGGGPGHSLYPGQDAAIRQSRLSRGRDPAALQGLLDGA